MLAGRRIFKNFSSLVAAKVLDRSLRFVAYTYLARRLGSDGFGMVAFASAVIFFFVSISDLGLNVLATREIARCRDKVEEVRRYVDNVVTLKIIFSFLSLFLMSLFVLSIRKPTLVKHITLIYGISLFFNNLSFGWAFLGLEEMHFVAISNSINGICDFVLLMLLVKDIHQILYVPAIESFTLFLSVSYLVVVFRKRVGQIRLRVDLSFWKWLVAEAFPLAISLIMIRAYAYSGILILGLLGMDNAVGWFRAANMIPSFLGYIGLVFADTIFPAASRYFVQAGQKFETLMSYSVKLLAMTSLPISVGGTILAEPIMRYVYGPDYESSIEVFRILIWSPFISCLSSTYCNSLPACDEQKSYSLILVAQTAANVILGMVLIPLYGPRGAAIALLVSETLSLILSFSVFQHKVKKIPFIPYLLRPMVASGAMAFFLMLFSGHHLLITMGGAIIVYFGILIPLGGISPNELSILRKQILRI